MLSLYKEIYRTLLNFSNAVECASSDSHTLSGNIELYIVTEELYCMTDYERIDQLEKDVAYMMDLYAKVVIAQEKIIIDCGETFAVLASDLHMIRKMILEMEIELTAFNKTAV